MDKSEFIKLGRSGTIQLFQFLSRVNIPADPEGCWEWTGGSCAGGYGLFTSNKKRYVASRFVMALFGDVAGWRVCHKCDNPPCVNPDHLFLGTPGDNTEDAVLKGRMAYKLTKEQALAIASSVGPLQDEARKYGVSQSLISSIRHGASWRHLTGKPRVKREIKYTPQLIESIVSSPETAYALTKRTGLAKSSISRIRAHGKNVALPTGRPVGRQKKAL